MRAQGLIGVSSNKGEVDKRGGEFEAKWGESISQRTGAAARLKNERASGANEHGAREVVRTLG